MLHQPLDQRRLAGARRRRDDEEQAASVARAVRHSLRQIEGATRQIEDLERDGPEVLRLHLRAAAGSVVDGVLRDR